MIKIIAAFFLIGFGAYMLCKSITMLKKKEYVYEELTQVMYDPNVDSFLSVFRITGQGAVRELQLIRRSAIIGDYSIIAGALFLLYNWAKVHV